MNWGALVEEKEEREKGELQQFMWGPLMTFLSKESLFSFPWNNLLVGYTYSKNRNTRYRILIQFHYDSQWME